jgi:hypothetical protein
MDAPTRHAIERLSRDRLKNRHDRYTINCTYGLASPAHKNAVSGPQLLAPPVVCAHRLSCQKEVDDLRERMQAMIDQRMRKSRVGAVVHTPPPRPLFTGVILPHLDRTRHDTTLQPNRAEEMLQQPELFDLSDFAKYVVVTCTATN